MQQACNGVSSLLRISRLQVLVGLVNRGAVSPVGNIRRQAVRSVDVMMSVGRGQRTGETCDVVCSVSTALRLYILTSRTRQPRRSFLSSPYGVL